MLIYGFFLKINNISKKRVICKMIIELCIRNMLNVLHTSLVAKVHNNLQLEIMLLRKTLVCDMLKVCFNT